MRILQPHGAEDSLTEQTYRLIVSGYENVYGALENDRAGRAIRGLPGGDIKKDGFDEIQHLSDKEQIKEPLGGWIHCRVDAPIEVPDCKDYRDDDQHTNRPETGPRL